MATLHDVERKSTSFPSHKRWVRTHPLEGDGLIYAFYNLMWKKKPPDVLSCPGVRFPDTLIFDHDVPRGWFICDTKHDEIRKKVGRELDVASILAAFGEQPDPAIDIVSTHRYTYDGPDGTPVTCVEFLTKKQLEEFVLQSRGRRREGILQKFVLPRGDRNNVIQVIWSPRMCISQRRTSKFLLSAKDIPPFERAATFEGSAHLASEGLCAGSTAEAARAMCERVARHIAAVEGNIEVARMVVYMKSDRSAVSSAAGVRAAAAAPLTLLYVASMRVSHSGPGRAIASSSAARGHSTYGSPHDSGTPSGASPNTSAGARTRGAPRGVRMRGSPPMLLSPIYSRGDESSDAQRASSSAAMDGYALLAADAAQFSLTHDPSFLSSSRAAYLPTDTTRPRGSPHNGTRGREPLLPPITPSRDALTGPGPSPTLRLLSQPARTIDELRNLLHGMPELEQIEDLRRQRRYCKSAISDILYQALSSFLKSPSEPFVFSIPGDGWLRQSLGTATQDLIAAIQAKPIAALMHEPAPTFDGYVAVGPHARQILCTRLGQTSEELQTALLHGPAQHVRSAEVSASHHEPLAILEREAAVFLDNFFDAQEDQIVNVAMPQAVQPRATQFEGAHTRAADALDAVAEVLPRGELPSSAGKDEDDEGAGSSAENPPTARKVSLDGGSVRSQSQRGSDVGMLGLRGVMGGGSGASDSNRSDSVSSATSLSGGTDDGSSSSASADSDSNDGSSDV